MMVYSSIYGGLGNQMFQYAVAKNISIINKVEFKLDIGKIDESYLRKFLLSRFNISATIATDQEVERFRYNKYVNHLLKQSSLLNRTFGNKIFEKKEFAFDVDILGLRNGYIEGYWQSFKYFEKIRTVLLDDFMLVSEMNSDNKLIFDKINAVNSVSIHIRRGDYLKSAKNRRIYNVVGLDYYKNAIAYIKTQIENPHFFVFSDDLEWASRNLNLTDVTFVNINSVSNPENDLVLMSKCNHNIIANSTFSWWAAWLNKSDDKIVIAPKRWMSTVTDLDDLYPRAWIKL